MKILFACGGTAGHINPALATANYIRSRYPDTQVLFIGSPKGMEARLVPEAGYDFAPVELKGIQRRLSWHNFCYNLSSMELLCTCWGSAAFCVSSSPMWWWEPAAMSADRSCGRQPGWDSGRSPMNPMPIPA